MMRHDGMENSSDSSRAISQTMSLDFGTHITVDNVGE